MISLLQETKKNLFIEKNQRKLYVRCKQRLSSGDGIMSELSFSFYLYQYFIFFSKKYIWIVIFLIKRLKSTLDLVLTNAHSQARFCHFRRNRRWRTQRDSGRLRITEKLLFFVRIIKRKWFVIIPMMYICWSIKAICLYLYQEKGYSIAIVTIFYEAVHEACPWISLLYYS